MKLAPLTLSIVLIPFLLVTALFAQEPPAAESAAPTEQNYDFARSPEESMTLGPANKVFIENYFEFRECTKKLNRLKVEYVSAKPERQIQIDQEYALEYEKGSKINRQMRDWGLDAFDEAPNKNPFVLNYLYNLISWEFFRDEFEEPVRLFKRIAAKEVFEEANILYAYAGLAAIMTMDLDEATHWLDIATKNGGLEKLMTELAKTEKGRDQVRSLEGFYYSIAKFKPDWEKEQEIRQREAAEGDANPSKKLPRVLLETTKGNITIELFENQAPNTVANFVSLVEKGFYDGTVFHRVLPMFMAQGGDPTGTGMGGPGYNIDCECKRPDARKHFRGTLSMANAGPNTNGSQFFLTFVPTAFLDGRHTVFGRVVDGMPILSEIQRVDPSDEDARIPVLDKIKKATVLNKRDHEYVPIKNQNSR